MHVYHLGNSHQKTFMYRMRDYTWRRVAESCQRLVYIDLYHTTCIMNSQTNGLSLSLLYTWLYLWDLNMTHTGKDTVKKDLVNYIPTSTKHFQNTRGGVNKDSTLVFRRTSREHANCGFISRLLHSLWFAGFQERFLVHLSLTLADACCLPSWR